MFVQSTCRAGLQNNFWPGQHRMSHDEEEGGGDLGNKSEATGSITLDFSQ